MGTTAFGNHLVQLIKIEKSLSETLSRQPHHIFDIPIPGSEKIVQGSLAHCGTHRLNYKFYDLAYLHICIFPNFKARMLEKPSCVNDTQFFSGSYAAI